MLAGVALAPLLVGAVLTAGWASRTTARLGARRLVGGGLAVMAVSMAATSFAKTGTTYWWFAVAMILLGSAYMAAQTAWTVAFMSAMPDAVVGASAGVTRATMATGAALGGVLLSTIVLLVGQADLIQRLTAQQLSPAQVAAAVVALNAALTADAALTITPLPSDFDPALRAAYLESYTVGFSASMLAGAALCLISAALAWFVLRPTTKATGSGMRQSAACVQVRPRVPARLPCRSSRRRVNRHPCVARIRNNSWRLCRATVDSMRPS